MLDQAFEVARAAAREAAALLADAHGRAHTIEHKSARTDLVTESDRAAEALIVARLRAAFPGHALLAEEGGALAGDGRHRWLIDPLDGTVNFAHGHPVFAVSIALERDGVIELGVVRAPLLGWEFAARRGGGATRDGAPCRVSATAALDQALLATGFPYDRRTNPDNNLDQFARFQTEAGAVRRLGAAALDLAFVACGWLDGFWEMKLSPWDVAAGVLLVREAGGRVTDWNGAPVQCERHHVVASNGRIHDAMLATIAAVDGGAGRRRE